MMTFQDSLRSYFTTAPSSAGTSNQLPGQVHFLMIDKCNAACVFCGGDYYRSKSGRVITLEKFKIMARNLGLERFHGICLAGAGDPLLNPDFIPIVRYVNETYPKVEISITTNGIALTPAMSQALTDADVKLVNISINAATRESYERLMQVDQFDRVVSNAREYMTIRQSKGRGPVLQLSIALSRVNIEDFPTLVELAHDLNIKYINSFYCRFYPEKIRHLNIEAPQYRLEDKESLFFFQPLSDEILLKTKQLAHQYGISLATEPLFRENVQRRRCFWTETELMVGFDGEVYPCGGGEVHFKEKVASGEYHFGNVLTEPLEDFWNNDMYRALRLSACGEANLVSECSHCANILKSTDIHSHLMNWGDDFDQGEKAVTNNPQAEQPLVSVIVPTHNRPDTLLDTIRSINEQTYQNIEIIVVNDCGTDVESILKPLNGRGNISYARHARNRGLGAARNTGIKLAQGKYIAYLDDDDLFYPDHVETLVTFLENNAEYKVAYTDAYRAQQVKDKGRYVVCNRDIPYSYDFDYDAILVNNFVPVLCFMHEKACIDAAGNFDESLTTHEDWDLWIRMSRKFRFAHIKKVTSEFTWRNDGTSMSSSKTADFLKTARIIFDKYRGYVADKPHILEAQQKNIRHREMCLSQEQAQKGDVAAKKAADLDPVIERGDAAANAGDYAAAATHYKEALLLDRESVRAGIGLGVAQLLSGLLHEAVASFTTVLNYSPEESKALTGLGLAYLQDGKYREAFLSFEKCLQIDPENLTALHELVKAAYLTGRFADAARRVDGYLRYHPADLDMLFSLAGLQYKAGDNAPALDSIEKILLFAPDYPGAEELRLKIKEDTSATVAEADDEGPATFGAGKGRKCKAEGDFREALEYLTGALAAGDRSVLADIGDCHARLGDFCQAEEAYRQVLVEGGNPAKAYTGLGVLALVDGRADDAVRQFEKALTAAPGDVSAQTGLGMAFVATGKTDEAFQSFSAALQSDPENLQALHELVKLAYQLQAHREAEEHLQRYLMHHPADLDMLFTVAGLQYTGGRLAEAMESVEKVLLFAPDYEGAEELREMIAAA